MAEISVNNRQGSRDRQAVILIGIEGKGIFLFVGDSIPGLVRILNSQFTKDGKWSHTTWLLDVADGVEVVRFHQGWDTGCFIESETWKGAINELQGRFKTLQFTEAQIERAIRSIFPKVAERLDREAAEWSAESDAIVSELIAAQEAISTARRERVELLVQVAQLEKAQLEKAEAARISDLNKKVAAQLNSGQKINLADLKAMLTQ